MIGTQVQDEITTLPEIAAAHGRAWRCDLDGLRRKLGVARDGDATLVMWVIEAPWAHPFWHSYVLVLVHLRPLPDGRPTKLYFEGATHELWLHALDPGGRRQPLISGFEPLGSASCRPLTPINFAAQFIEPDDTSALGRVERAVRRVCNGTLSPDTDFIRQWMHLFGDNMIKGDKKRAGETRIVIGAEGERSTELVIPPRPGPQDLN